MKRNSTIPPPQYLSPLPTWTPAFIGVWKINVDASCIPGYEGIGIAVEIRDHMGIVHGGMFKHYPGSVDVETVELLAVQDGLHFASKHQFRLVIFESDA